MATRTPRPEPGISRWRDAPEPAWESARVDEICQTINETYGVTEEQNAELKAIWEAGKNRDLTDSEERDFRALADALENANFHTESIAFHAAAGRSARLNGNSSRSDNWPILVDASTPDEMRAQIRAEDPSSAESADRYLQHANRVAFEM